MNPWSIIIPIIGVIVAPILTYIVAVRKTSGRVDTTEAATLWAEAEKMREIYRQEGIELRAQIRSLEDRLDKARDESEAARQESKAARQESQTARAESETLREALAKLQKNTDTLINGTPQPRKRKR